MSIINNRFRKNSVLYELRYFLPIDLIYNIYPYLFDTNYKKHFDFCLVFIPIKAKTKNYKRCTPCKECRKINTYSVYCDDCDMQKWWDIT